MSEQDLRALLGAFAREVGDELNKMSTLDLVAALAPRVEATERDVAAR